MCQYFNDYFISLLYFKGGAQISLADFNVQTPVRFRWYNLLSCAVSKIQQQQLSLFISKFLSPKNKFIYNPQVAKAIRGGLRKK